MFDITREKAAKMRMNYSYGDDEAKKSLFKVLDGKDTLFIGSDLPGDNPKDARGKTVLDENGRRIMYAKSSNSSDFDVWLSESVTLANEAYRDGYVTADNKEETRDAVKGHVRMAENLAAAYGGGFLGKDKLLGQEVMLHQQFGDKVLDAIADQAYGSEEDFWTVKVDAEGKLRIKYDGENDVYFEGEDGKRTLLIRHDEEKFSEIKALRAALNSGTAIDSTKAGEMQTKLKKLENEYYTVENDGYTLERLVHTLEFGTIGNKAGWDRMIENGASHGNALAEFAWKIMLAEGWNGGTGWNTKGQNYGSDHTWYKNDSTQLDSSFGFDITNYFLSFNGTDKEQISNLLGDKNKISDKVFTNLHSEFIKAKILDYSRDLLREYKGTPSWQEYDLCIENNLATVMRNVRNDFGVIGRNVEDPYSKRLSNEIDSYTDIGRQTIKNAFSWKDKNQKELSTKLKWGWDNSVKFGEEPNPHSYSSLCWVVSLMQAHDLNTGNYNDFDTFKAYLKKLSYLDEDGVMYADRDNKIGSDGKPREDLFTAAGNVINNQYKIVKQYALLTETEVPIQLSKNIARYGMGRMAAAGSAVGKHSVVWDFKENEMEYDPYPCPKYTSFVGKNRYTYIRDVLSYRFWRNY